LGLGVDLPTVFVEPGRPPTGSGKKNLPFCQLPVANGPGETATRTGMHAQRQRREAVNAVKNRRLRANPRQETQGGGELEGIPASLSAGDIARL
jgi:hypothetical protein